ncbi:MAG: lecithin retinol acyltransferase family protein [Acholeplasmatales bacterium]|nr:lecithin retinol acyltransferase family protein [Acholeplasmatales bacterium]
MWTKRDLKFGDQIRVNRGFYYHHGIYEDDNHIYQYAAKEGSEVSQENALIICTNLKTFAKDGEVEARDYNEEELKKLRPKEEIIKTAKDMLGTGLGEYNLVTNNCEHFSNYCAFGKKESNQVNDFLNMLFGNK